MSESGPTIHAIRYEETLPMAAPSTIRSSSLSGPAGNPPLYLESRSISTSASSNGSRVPSPLSYQHASRLAPSTPMAQEGRSRSEGDHPGLVSLQSLRSIPSIVVNDPSSRPSSRPGSRPGSRWSERWGGLRSKRSMEFERKAESPPPVPQLDSRFSGIPLSIPTASLDGLGDQSMRFSKRGSLIKDENQQEQQKQQPQPQQPPQSPPQSQQEQQKQQPPPPSPPSSPPEKNQHEKGDEGNQPQQKPEQAQEEEQKVTTPPPSASTEHTDPGACVTATRRPNPPTSLRVRTTSIPSRAISADEDMLSRRVRLMYEKGEENVTDSEVARSIALENGVLWEEPVPVPTSTNTSAISGPGAGGAETRSISSSVVDSQSFKREANELAGGIEYWQNVGAGDVDRYGFIRRPTTNSSDGMEPNPIQRVSTSLLLASESPRRKHSVRPTSSSNRSFAGRSPTRKLSEPAVARPSSSQSTHSAILRRSTSRFRQAANHLPHNRDRKFKDEAADMLTLPTNMVNAGVDGPMTRAMKKKEWEREDKWTKMARPSTRGKIGGGMRFEFDTQSSKLIERTWKGIPDRWRATAWFAFLEASAKKDPESPAEEDLISAYNEFQFMSSPDDVQIDIDVPRTITSHIMFRRRYRGGQRLLFRVLHAMSLYFPDTGYVQGMAALAATLLAYYDEENAFIMLVRLWQLRGLERLYQSGFAGLMEALSDFEREWLERGEVAAKLNEIGVPPTAYGTRWYLTLFNYSIPFPAQLRVWDVFMLLGDAGDVASPEPSMDGVPPTRPFGRGLDVLHASSAALIDGMRDIILDSDFENAMKVLTSWVPIKDVELFMRVAKAEWKVHRRKRN